MIYFPEKVMHVPDYVHVIKFTNNSQDFTGINATYHFQDHV